LAVAALAVPAFAGPVETTVSGQAVNTINQDTLRSTLVYDHSLLNGYLNSWAVGDEYKAELCLTTATAPWMMDGFTIAPAVNADGAYNIDIWFYEESTLGVGYAPDVFVNAPDAIVPVSFNVTGTGGLLSIVEVSVDLSATPINFTDLNVWMCYRNDANNNTYGVAHVDPGGIGVDYYGNGWIEQNSLGFWWYWYGGVPNADLYAKLSMVPEPAGLLLIGLGVLALRRR
jgi:hypothetical protein